MAWVDNEQDLKTKIISTFTINLYWLLDWKGSHELEKLIRRTKMGSWTGGKQNFWGSENGVPVEPSEIEVSKLWPTIFIVQPLNKWFLKIEKIPRNYYFFKFHEKYEIQISMSVKIFWGHCCVHLFTYYQGLLSYHKRKLRANRIWHIRLKILISRLPGENFLTSDLKTKEDMMNRQIFGNQIKWRFLAWSQE